MALVSVEGIWRGPSGGIEGETVNAPRHLPYIMPHRGDLRQG